MALILHLIVNREPLLYGNAGKGQRSAEQVVSLKYWYFLISVTAFYIVDIAWGILYEHHDIPGLFPVLYSDGVFYYILMLLTMLTWVRFIVSFLGKRGRPGKSLLYVVWAIFTAGLICLMVNRFFPFIFYFTEDHAFVPGKGRYIAFIIQIVLYIVTSTYMLIQAGRTYGQEKISCTAVGLTSIVLEVFLILQFTSPSFPFYSMGLIIGTCVVNSFVIAGQKREKEIYDNIAKSLAEDYEAMYYIDIESGRYREFHTSEEYVSMNVTALGKDFYTETQANAIKYAHPDDKEFAESLYHKDTMLKNLEGKKSFSYKYRVMLGGEPRYFRFTVMKANDGKHFVLYEKDIDDEMTAETMRLESQKKHITFSRIAESLASNYDMIYYVDVERSDYVSYATNNLYGELKMHKSGDDFFSEAANDIPKVVHKNDRDMVAEFLERDHLISAMSRKKGHSIDYRLMINGRPQYVRMSVRKTSDGTHYIIGVENIDAEVRKEKQQLKALNTEKELARRDELTGTKNKNAYAELEQSVQANMDKGMDYLPFAIVVCDANNLKMVNDTEGHVAGDEYIRSCAKLLCDIFSHSPVFRIGGDEFAVFLRGNDYTARDNLMYQLKSQVRENQSTESGPVLASGMSEYVPEKDTLVTEVFDRADHNMYEDKQNLKGGR